MQSLHIFTPKSRQLLIYFLYLFICSFWIIRKWNYKICGLLCFLLSFKWFWKMTYIIACFSTYFFLVEVYWFCWYCDQLMIIWISICWLSWTVLLKVCVQVLWRHIFISFPLIPWSRIVVKFTFNILKIAKLFSKMAIPL